MADPLYLSLWLKSYSALALPVYLKKALSVFPVSKLSPGAILRVYALSFREAPQLEEFYDGEVDAQDAAARAQDLLHEDCAIQVETKWDLYQWDEEWQLKPARVWIEVYGPEFESDRGEHVRIDFGDEGLFLPSPRSDQLRPVQSNIRSLLHLTQDLAAELSAERQLLWSDNDEDFIEQLRAALD
jgi:hypothetical protein